MRKTVKLCEVGEIVTGTTPSKKEPKYWGGSVPFVKPPHLGTDKLVVGTEETLTEEGSKKGNLIPKNSIMVCCIGSLGKIGIAGKDLCTNQQINSIIFNDKLVDFKYGYYFCTTLEAIMNKMANQAIIQIINKSSFSNIQIPLPPLETQKAIVAKLDQIFAELDQTKSEIQKNLDNADELWKSSLNQAFQGDWEVKAIEEMTNSIEYGVGETGLDTGDLRYVRITDIDENYQLKDYDKKYIMLNDKSKLSLLNKGDVLIARTGATFGKCLYFESDEKSAFAGYLIRPNFKKEVNTKYFSLFAQSGLYWNQANSLVSGGGQPQFNANAIKKIKFIVPPLSEQEKIVEHLDQVSQEVKQLKSEYQSQLDNLEELKKSVLDKAFRGELVE